MDTKLTVRVPKQALTNAKLYAKTNQTTLTQLISTFLEQLPSVSDILDDAPVVRRLTGLLSPEISIEDYKEHLVEKYGR